jgi:hypothetical protein
VIPASMIAHVSDQVRRALDFALTNIGVCENPVGSNRGPEIDAWAREFGSPLGSYWCALAVAKARKEGGLWVPARDAGACNAWVSQGIAAGLLTTEPRAGRVVVYTNHERIASGVYAGQLDAVHMGLVLRVHPVLCSIEGNTTLGPYDRNGYIRSIKAVERARVLCYIRADHDDQ